MCAVLIFASHVFSAGKLNLKDITSGVFSSERMTEVKPFNDGETYTQISSDGKQIVRYSFKTGKQVEILFDANNVRGDKLQRIDGYIISAAYSTDNKSTIAVFAAWSAATIIDAASYVSNTPNAATSSIFVAP